MINLNRIRSLKTLSEMRRDLNEFLSNPIIISIYLTDLKWGGEDYDADTEQARDLLEQVDRRMKSLERFEKKTQKTPVP